jgi:hypothetical protein
MLIQETVKHLFDYKDGVLYWKESRKGGCSKGDAASAIRGRYGVVGINGVYYSTHRVIFLYHHGYLPDRVDHRDGNPFNNRIENLRECTHSENMRNRKINKNNKSGCKGVTWDKEESKWRVRLSLDGKRIHLGRFSSYEEAEAAANNARDFYHGEFARYK